MTQSNSSDIDMHIGLTPGNNTFIPQIKGTTLSAYVCCVHKYMQLCMQQEMENRTVGERVLGSAEDVALLLVSTLDSNENGTMSRNITRDNISKCLILVTVCSHRASCVATHNTHANFHGLEFNS